MKALSPLATTALAVGAVSITGIIVAFGWSPPQGGTPAPGYTPVSPQDHFPAELVELVPYPVLATVRAPNLRGSVWFNRGSKEVEMKRSERAGAGTLWYNYESTITTSFRITDVAARPGGEELFVAGIADNGDDVIERWVARARTGGWAMRCATSPVLPVGTPMPPYAVTHLVVGGTFVPPGPRQAIAPERDVIFRSTAVGKIRSMIADPEGRYLLLLSFTTSSMYRLDLLTTPMELFALDTVSTLPHLSAAKSLWIGDFSTQGRKCCLSELADSTIPEGSGFTVLDDTDNNGIFESKQTFSEVEWAASPYSNYASNSWKNLWNQAPPLNTSGQ